MNTNTFYHGTNANPISIMDDAKASSNINGFGFYCTTSAEVAKRYGKNVIAFVMDASLELSYIQRPIDQRYVDNLASYKECEENGVECVFNNTNQLILDNVNTYVVH